MIIFIYTLRDCNSVISDEQYEVVAKDIHEAMKIATFTNPNYIVIPINSL